MDVTRRKMLQWANALAGLSLLPLETTMAEAAVRQPIVDTGDDDPSATDGLLNLFDYERAARGHLSEMVYAFVAGGAGDEITVRWNREALDRIRLRPRNLHDVSQVDTQIRDPGLDLPLPIMLAPIGFQRLIHQEGELATVRGAGSAGVTTVVSMGTTTAIEDLTRAATAPVWLQMYFLYGRPFVQDLVARAEAAGVRAIVLTIDTPSNGARNRQDRAKFAVPADLAVPHMTPTGRQLAAADDAYIEKVTWKDVEWLRSIVRVPLWIKGVLNPEDAEQAIRVGTAGIIVSNHGGRNLDTNPATIDALPHVVEAVAGRVPILMDGGIRRGTDVLKALALGAHAVLIGRPYAYGLATAGSDGVAQVIKILQAELMMAMKLTGRATLASIDRSVLWVPAS